MKFDKPNEDTVYKLFLFNSLGPLALSAMILLLGIVHEMSGGGEWTAGAILGIVVVPLIGIWFLIASILAIVQCLWVRTPALLFLGLLQSAILVLVGIFGTHIITYWLFLYYVAYGLASILLYLRYKNSLGEKRTSPCWF